jgi:transcriptional regulator with XRE-family HTH domain
MTRAARLNRQAVLSFLKPFKIMALSAAERKAAMIIRGLSQRDLAEALGVSRSLIGMVITGRHRNDRVERYIAQQLGRPVEEVFPAREQSVAVA